MKDALIARLEPRLRRIEACCAQLSALASEPWSAVAGDPMRSAAMERWLEVAIQSAVDTGSALLAQRGGQMPETYRGVFAALADDGALTREHADRLQEAAGLRNVLAHGYLDVDDERLHASLQQDVADLLAFVAAVDLLLQG